jgi:hypothetical protein
MKTPFRRYSTFITDRFRDKQQLTKRAEQTAYSGVRRKR